MYLPISGNFTVTPPADSDAVQLEELYLSVDTSLVPCNITLPPITAFGGFLNNRIYVNDRTGNAGTNNITIIADAANTIDRAATLTIDTDGDGVEVFITDKLTWRTTSGGNVNLLWSRGAGAYSLQHINNNFPNTATGDNALAMGASGVADKYAERALSSGGYAANSLPAQFGEMTFRNRTTDGSTLNLWADFLNGDSQVLAITNSLYCYIVFEGRIQGMDLGTGEILQADVSGITSAHNAPLTNSAPTVVINLNQIAGGSTVALAIVVAGAPPSISITPTATGRAGRTIDWFAYLRYWQMRGNV